MKKIISRIIMTVVLAIVLLAGPVMVFADKTAAMTIDDVSGFPGGTVVVNVGLENLPENNVSGAQFRVSYDADVLELIAVDEFGGILTGGGQGKNDLNANPYIISYGDGISVINTDTSGQIAAFTFRISEDAEEGSTSNVNVEYDQIISANDYADEIPVAAETVSGTVTIKSSVHEHEFGEWETITEATCTEEGIKSRTCTICGNKEYETIEKTEHDSTDWIVQKKADCTESGSKIKKCKRCGEILAEETIAATGHVPYTEIVDEATCTEEGKSQTVCSVCETVLGEDTIPAKGHTPGEWVVEQEATCTQDGLRARYCVDCEELIETGVTEESIGHVEGEWTVDIEPTCEGEGEKILTCSRCGDVIDVEYLEPLGHAWGDWETIKQATVDAEGLEERTCTTCANVEKRVIPKIGHETCDHNFNGEERYSPEPTCTESGIKRIYCSVEGCDAYVEEIVPAVGHVEGEWLTTLEPSCTEEGTETFYCGACGEILGTRGLAPLSHEFEKWTITKAPSCTESGERSAKCTRCGQSVTETIAPEQHTFGEWKVTKEASCLEEGRQERFCEKCQTTETETVPATGHKEGEWTTEKESTCQETGQRVKRCQTCGEILESELIDRKEHSVEIWTEVKTATCQEGGSKEGVCTECGETITQATPKTDHTISDTPVITLQPTCTEDGKQEYRCKHCDEVIRSEDVPATGHNYGDPVITKEPTCVEAGEQTQECANCGEKRHTTLSPTGHAYGEPVVTKTATYNSEGTAVRTCEVCGDKLTVTIPKVDSSSHVHDYNGKGVVAKEATCKEKGERHIYCSDPLCDSYRKEEIPFSDHQFNDWVVKTEPTHSAEGVKERSCDICGYVETASIPSLAGDSGESIESASVICQTEAVYTGQAITPNPTVKVGISTLKKGGDYEIAYKNNINAGKATITITGKGKYEGTITKTFNIIKADQPITAKAAASSVAVGKTTSVSITGAKGTKSYKSSDTTIATVTSAGKVTAKKVGTVKITATSDTTANYNAASKTVTIKVVPAATVSLTAENQATGIKLTWKKVAGANGYKVYRGSTLIKTITSGSTVTYTDTRSNTNGTKYTYKIVAKGTTGDSTLSKSCVIYRVARPAISSVTNSASRKMTVKWGKNAKANGYQLQYSTDKAFKSGNKSVTITSASTVSRVIGSLTKGKTYYVRIRTYKTVGSAKYWSVWSATKSVKISK